MDVIDEPSHLHSLSTSIANSKRSWVKVGMLSNGRTRCSCTVLSSGIIVVAAGSTSIDSSLSQTVEVAVL